MTRIVDHRQGPAHEAWWAQREGLPFTQVAVALAFLKERGIVDTRYRRNYAATRSVHLDAMTEFYAIGEAEAWSNHGFA